MSVLDRCYLTAQSEPAKPEEPAACTPLATRGASLCFIPEIYGVDSDLSIWVMRKAFVLRVSACLPQNWEEPMLSQLEHPVSSTGMECLLLQPSVSTVVFWTWRFRLPRFVRSGRIVNLRDLPLPAPVPAEQTVQKTKCGLASDGTCGAWFPSLNKSQSPK